jgi:hypothetical protein
MLSFYKVTFHGQRFIWMENLLTGEGSLTLEQFFKDQDPEKMYAFIQEDGFIIRLRTKIGHKNDFTNLEKLK